MDVDLGVEGTLVVDDVHDVRDIKTSSSNICTHKDGSITMTFNYIFLGLLFTKLDGFVFDLLNGSLKSIKTLQTLLLLHLTMKGMVLDFQEVKDARDSLGTSD